MSACFGASLLFFFSFLCFYGDLESGVQCVRWHSRLADQRHVALRRRSGQQQEKRGRKRRKERRRRTGGGALAVTLKSVLRSAGVLVM